MSHTAPHCINGYSVQVPCEIGGKKEIIFASLSSFFTFFFSWTWRYRLSKFSLSISSLSLWLSHLRRTDRVCNGTQVTCIVPALCVTMATQAHTQQHFLIYRDSKSAQMTTNQPFPSAFTFFMLPVSPQVDIVLQVLRWMRKDPLTCCMVRVTPTHTTTHTAAQTGPANYNLDITNKMVNRR